MYSIQIPVQVTVQALDPAFEAELTRESTAAAAKVFVDMDLAMDAFASENWVPWEGAPGRLQGWSAEIQVERPGLARVSLTCNVEAKDQAAAEVFAAEFVELTLTNPTFNTSPNKQVVVAEWNIGA